MVLFNYLFSLGIRLNSGCSGTPFFIVPQFCNTRHYKTCKRKLKISFFHPHLHHVSDYFLPLQCL